jgi:cytoskeleton protein RodZ
MSEIGQQLREARIRARIDVSEIEAKTKIRAKYLRALENEEWSLLPGPTYTKSFLRTYAQALGLDGRAIVEEYRERYEGTERERREMLHPPSRQRRTHERRPLPRGYLIGGTLLALVILLALIGSLSGPSEKQQNEAGGVAARHLQGAPGARRAPYPATVRTQTSTTTRTGAAQMVTLALRPSARVWVCLIGDGKRLIPGAILTPEEATEGRNGGALIFHARHFKVNLGDSHVELLVDGRRHEVPPSAEPIGYSISAAGLKSLAPAERPTCG